MPTTPRGYPYPSEHDPYDPQQVRRLAEAIDNDVGSEAAQLDDLDGSALRGNSKETITGAWTFEGHLAVSEPFLDVRARGVSVDGSPDENTHRLQRAINDVAAARGTLLIPATGGNAIRCKALQLPKRPGWAIRGVESRGSRIEFVNLARTRPGLSWDTSTTGHVEHQTIADCSISRVDDGAVIQFRQSAQGGSGGQGDRWSGRLRNLRVSCGKPKQGPRKGTLIDIVAGIKGHLEDVRVDGGRLGVCLSDSSHMLIQDLYADEKDSAPNLIEIRGGGSHTLIAPRSEGSQEHGASFFLHSCRQSTIIDPKTEGHRERHVYCIDNCRGIVIINPGIAYPDDSTSSSIRGMKIVNSKAVRIIGGFATPFNSNSRDAYVIEIDPQCRAVSVEGLTLKGGSTANEFLNAGVDCWVVAYAEASGSTFVSGQGLGGGLIARGAPAYFGTATDHPTELYQNNAARVRLSTSDVGMLNPVTLVASRRSRAGLRVPHGTAPTAPIDGDIWTTTDGIFVHINGTTRSVNLS